MRQLSKCGLCRTCNQNMCCADTNHTSHPLRTPRKRRHITTAIYWRPLAAMEGKLRRTAHCTLHTVHTAHGTTCVPRVHTAHPATYYTAESTVQLERGYVVVGLCVRARVCVCARVRVCACVCVCVCAPTVPLSSSRIQTSCWIQSLVLIPLGSAGFIRPAIIRVLLLMKRPTKKADWKSTDANF